MTQKYDGGLEATKGKETIRLLTNGFQVGLYWALYVPEQSLPLQITHNYKTGARKYKKLISDLKDRGFTIKEFGEKSIELIY